MREFFRVKSNLILVSILLVLTIALSATVCVTVQKQKALDRAKEKTAAVSESLKTTQEELEEQQQANSDLQSQLQEREAQKQQLEQQVAGLQEQITQLKAQKQQNAAPAQPTPQPAPAPAPTPMPTDPNRICYLTFDDGPSDNTLRILDILAQYNVKATFFVVGNTGKISYIQRIHAEGHTVGLHSNCHNYAAIYANETNYFNDLQQLSDTVESLIGIKSRVIRFPGGGSNVISKRYCPGIMSHLSVAVQERGYRYFDWNVSSQDASGIKYTPQQLAANVINAAVGKQQICVLMHDAAAKKNTVESLPMMIEGLRAQGFTFAALTPESYGFHHGINN